MSSILSIHARQILDSRGIPTIEAEITLEDGKKGHACVPSGASTGRYEAWEKRDGDDSRYHGRGVEQAVQAVRGEISDTVQGMDAYDQRQIDRTLNALDGTKNKSRLGANAILAVSLAVARAAAASQSIPLYRYLGGIRARVLPVPMMNILNGGAHADNPLDLQEFMIMPLSGKGAGKGFAENLRMGVEIFHTLKKLLEEKKLGTTVGDEGGFAPAVRDHAQALELLCEAIERAGYTPLEDVGIALDAAASQFYGKDGKYHLSCEGATHDAASLVEWYGRLVERFPILSIEDAMEEDDEKGWKMLSTALGDKIQLVGDDLFVTDVERLEKGIAKGLGNAILIKPNQIGTLSETIEAIEMAHHHSWRAIVSHRSGDTEDPFIADLAVGSQSSQIKTGAPARSERVAKYNRLLVIEEELGASASYAGYEALAKSAALLGKKGSEKEGTSKKGAEKKEAEKRIGDKKSSG